jgi:hypothetical protein
MSHAYSPSCPCYHCGLQEQQDERNIQDLERITAKLRTCPAIHGEVALDDSRAAATAAAAKDGDMAEVGRIMMQQVGDYIAGMLAARASAQPAHWREATKLAEAARELEDVYLVEGR